MALTELEAYCREQIINENYGDFILKRQDIDNILGEWPEEPCMQHLGGNFWMLHGPVVESLNYYSTPKLYGLMQVNGAEAANAVLLQLQPNLKLQGQGVLVGFVGTGINYRLPTFQTANGKTRIAAIWDQTIQSEEVPDGFGYGTVYTQEQIQTALEADAPFSVVPSTDTNGHGTYMAGVAAGSVDASNGFTGIVPEAELVVVKLKEAKSYLKEYYHIRDGAVAYQETDIMLGVQYLIGFARSKQRPIVIIMGVGTNQGDHSGRLPLSEILENYSTTGGVGIAVPTGNEGAARHHYKGTLYPTEAYQDVEINVGEGEKGFTLELWGKAPDLFAVSIIAPSGETTTTMPAGFFFRQEFRFLLEPTVIAVANFVTEAQTGNQLLQIRFLEPTAGIWRIRVQGSNLVNQIFHLWLPIGEFLQPDTYFLKPDPYVTITEPGNTPSTFTVGNYNSMQSAVEPNTGRGYTVTDYIKPDLAAPGVQILAPLLSGGYGGVSGSCIAVSVAGGVMAQIFQWGIVKKNLITMRTVDAKSYLIRGARRPSNFLYPNRDSGWGFLDGYGTFLTITSQSSSSI